MRRRAVQLSVFAAAALAVFCAAVHGQVFPSRPLRMIVPFPPAGAVDIASRAIANELQKSFGQPITIENRPGAGGNLGGEAAAKAAPDGYTLFMTTSGIQAINPALYTKMNYDPNRELAPVAPLVSLNNVLVLHPSVPGASVRDVIAMARANPGRITYASSGNGTSIHMSGELFKSLAGVDILHIPYKGSGPALSDLIGGQVNLMFDNIPSSLPHIKAGKLKALATTGAKRDPALPDLPTVAEAGVPGYESGVWFGIAVPAGTPKDIIARLNSDTIRGARSPEFARRMGDLGYLVILGTSDQMADMIKAEIARWTPVVKSSGAKVD